MKKVLYNSFLIIAAVSLMQSSFAQDNDHRNEPKFKKTKSFSKSYPLSGSDKVSLSNQFGEMKISTWDKNEIKVDVSITGKANEEARAQQILDKISILDSKNGNTVSFTTKFADDKWNNDNENSNGNRNSNRNSNRNDDRKDRDNNNNNNNEGMEINYVVFMPATGALKAENQFGKMIVPDFRGEADLTSKFGSLTAGKLSNSKEVTVEFGSADVASISGGDLNIKFSTGTVNNLTGAVNSDLQFSQVKLIVDNSTKTLTINNSYSTVYLDLDKGLSANYDISTSMGNFTNKSSFTLKEQEEDRGGYGPHFNNRYTGTSGGGGAKVKVNSSFGEVILGHNMQVDLTEKKKDKDKGSRTRTI